jgi:hypothetical protein
MDGSERLNRSPRTFEPPLPYFLLFALPLAAQEPALRADLETT